MRGPDYNVVFDLHGGQYIADTNGYPGPWAGYKALTNTQFSAISCNMLTGNLANLVLGAGDFLPFPQSSSFVQLVSGSGILINW